LAYLNPLGNNANQPAAFPNNNNRGLLFPLSIPAAISSSFGWRMHPIFGEWRMHTGTDIAAPQGTPVLASYQGQVAIADYVGGYGKMVILRHEDGSQESRYAHLSQIFVRPGEQVEQGEVIGLVGSTGNSTGPHLHFEWRHLMGGDWVPVDAGPHLEWALAEMGNVMTASLPETERLKFDMGKVALGSGMLMLPRGTETEITTLSPEDLDPAAVEVMPPSRQPLYRLDPLSGEPLPNSLDPALQADLGF
ncbi:MAG: M23 family metallopeptidase, partial [Spirulina sp. DLM2.Bin59]